VVNKGTYMSYSIRVLNESTGEEELFQGDNVDSVHKEIAENILFAKKCYNFQAEFKRKEKEVKKDLAIQTTKQIVAILESKKQILTKSINSRVKLWEVLRRSININFEEPLPQQKDNPIEPEFFQIPIEPDKSDEKYIIKKLFRDNIFKTKYLHKKLEAELKADKSQSYTA